MSSDRKIASSSVAVFGGGIMGRGIALALATAGHAVSVVEANTAVADALPERLEADARAIPELDAEVLTDALARVALVPDLESAVASADLVISAVQREG